jgi:hypothetical protein
MSEAIRFCRSLLKELNEKFHNVDIPEVVVNEELQRRQFKEFNVWFDSSGYLFGNLPSIDFSASIFERIVEIAKHFGSPRIFKEYARSDGEKGIEFMVGPERIVLLHDRFHIEREREHSQNPFIEELADELVKLYLKYGNRKKKTQTMDKTTYVA